MPPLFTITHPSLEWLISLWICWEFSPLSSVSPSRLSLSVCFQAGRGCCLLHAHHLHTCISRWSSTPACCFKTGPRFHLCHFVVQPVPELSECFGFLYWTHGLFGHCRVFKPSSLWDSSATFSAKTSLFKSTRSCVCLPLLTESVNRKIKLSRKVRRKEKWTNKFWISCVFFPNSTADLLKSTAGPERCCLGSGMRAHISPVVASLHRPLVKFRVHFKKLPSRRLFTWSHTLLLKWIYNSSSSNQSDAGRLVAEPSTIKAQLPEPAPSLNPGRPCQYWDPSFLIRLCIKIEMLPL